MWSALSYSISSRSPKRKKPKPTIINKKPNLTMKNNKKTPKCTTMNVLPTFIIVFRLEQILKNYWTQPVWFGIVFCCVCMSSFSPLCIFSQKIDVYIFLPMSIGLEEVVLQAINATNSDFTTPLFLLNIKGSDGHWSHKSSCFYQHDKSSWGPKFL